MTLDRRAIARLPVSIETWEIDVLDAPIEVEGEDLAGMFLVVEAKSGIVRHATPLRRGESLEEPLAHALVSPIGSASPARPRLIHCRTESVRARVSRVLKGLVAEVRRVDTLPALDAATRSLMEALGGVVPMPGITEDLPTWRRALRRLVDVAPWERLSDSVTFRFEGGPPGLAGSVAILIGLAGAQEGVVLFPSDAAYARFVEGHRDASSVRHADAITLYLYAADEVDPDERATCQEAGLELDGERFPHVVHLVHGELHPVDAAGQACLLAAVEAVCALCEPDPVEPEFEPRSARAITRHGVVHVRSTPSPLYDDDDDVPLASVYDHQLVLTGLVDPSTGSLDPEPALVLKLAKRDAERLASSLRAIDRLHVNRSPGKTTFDVGFGSPELVTLASVPSLDDDALGALWTRPRAHVVVSAGGAKRRGVKPRDFVFDRFVTLQIGPGTPKPAPAPAPSPSPGTRRPDPRFAGPSETWPKASATLLDYLAPALGEEGLPMEELKPTVDLGVVLWNATVFADYQGKPQILEQILASVAVAPVMGSLFESLVERKRTLFGGDPRLFEVVGVDVRDGMPFVKVNTRWPDGVPRG